MGPAILFGDNNAQVRAGLGGEFTRIASHEQLAGGIAGIDRLRVKCGDLAIERAEVTLLFDREVTRSAVLLQSLPGVCGPGPRRQAQNREIVGKAIKRQRCLTRSWRGEVGVDRIKLG